MDGDGGQAWVVLLAGLIGALGAIGGQLVASRSQGRREDRRLAFDQQRAEREHERWAVEQERARTERDLELRRALFTDYLAAVGPPVQAIVQLLRGWGHVDEHLPVRRPRPDELVALRAALSDVRSMSATTSLYASVELKAASSSLDTLLGVLGAGLPLMEADPAGFEPFLEGLGGQLLVSLSTITSLVAADLDR